MAGQAGRLGRVAISPDDVTYTTIGCITEGTFSGDMSVVDTTCHDDDQDTANVPGKRTNTLDVTGRYVESDAGQALVQSTYFGTGSCYVRWRMSEAVGVREYKSAASITSYEETMPNDDAAEFSATFQLTGPTTEAPQT
jgi:hypothetical protein